MRTLFAMLCAAAAAAAAMLLLSPILADAVVASYRFDSSDAVADLHAAVYMAANFLALLLGWALGWIIAGAGSKA